MLTNKLYSERQAFSRQTAQNVRLSGADRSRQRYGTRRTPRVSAIAAYATASPDSCDRPRRLKCASLRGNCRQGKWSNDGMCCARGRSFACSAVATRKNCTHPNSYVSSLSSGLAKAFQDGDTAIEELAPRHLAARPRVSTPRRPVDAWRHSSIKRTSTCRRLAVSVLWDTFRATEAADALTSNRTHAGRRRCCG